MLYDVCDERCERDVENHFCENSEGKPPVERGRNENTLSIISERKQL